MVVAANLYIYIYTYIWKDFPYMGRLPIYGKTSHMWEVFPYIILEDFPYMGKLPMYGKTSYIWEVSDKGYKHNKSISSSHIDTIYLFLG